MKESWTIRAYEYAVGWCPSLDPQTHKSATTAGAAPSLDTTTISLRSFAQPSAPHRTQHVRTNQTKLHELGCFNVSYPTSVSQAGLLLLIPLYHLLSSQQLSLSCKKSSLGTANLMPEADDAAVLSPCYLANA